MSKYSSPYKENNLKASEIVGTRKVTRKDLMKKKREVGNVAAIGSFPITKSNPYGPFYNGLHEKRD